MSRREIDLPYPLLPHPRLRAMGPNSSRVRPNPAGNTQDPSTSGSSSHSQSDDSDDSSPDDLSLEEAARKYPRVAIEELGLIQGVVFEDIRNFFDRVAFLKEQSQQPAVKRQATGVDAPRLALTKRPSNTPS